jgi:hypothetical protein
MQAEFVRHPEGAEIIIPPNGFTGVQAVVLGRYFKVTPCEEKEENKKSLESHSVKNKQLQPDERLQLFFLYLAGLKGRADL